MVAIKNLSSYLAGILMLVFTPLLCHSQTVGVVLSGGGATGMSHIGVLKELEANNIPIDYICGTSMGGVIAGLYASGYTVHQIEAMARSKAFQEIASGGIEDEYVYFFTKHDDDASLISLKFNVDSFIQTSIPTNVISATALDYTLMELFSGPGTAAGNNFDSLMIPFRCVASDIENKQEIIFREGNLKECVRASMSYPFWINPIQVDGQLLFDGGLYNNFPTDVMYNDFFPDIIIGSNVGDSIARPNADVLMTQIMNMLVMKREFSVICDNGILIEPKPDVSTFDFSGTGDAIAAGQIAAKQKMGIIKEAIERRVSKEELAAKRLAFQKKIPPFIVDKVEMDGINRAQKFYARNILDKKNGQTPITEFKPKYYRMFSDEKITSIYPRALYNDSSGFYDMYLDIHKARDLETSFGGNFSSRPINTGFVSLRYKILSRTALELEANSYFGRFYGSIQLKARLDLPTKLRFYIEPMFAQNRWDYFRSQATFFEDVKPSFLIKNDRYAGLRLGMPVFKKGRLKADYKFVQLRNEYYQTDQFLSSDTADLTEFRGQTIGLVYERSTLNEKQYANKGTYLTFSWRYVFGEEITDFGSTKPITQPLEKITVQHDWFRARLAYENYFMKKGPLTLGLATEGVYTNQPFFSNYTATMLAAPAFQPIPETKTLFQEQFRAHIYASAGLRAILQIRKNFDLRLEGYGFAPYQTILADTEGEAVYSPEFMDQWVIGSTALVFHSPLGPVSLSANYYDFNKEDPWSVLFNFGFIIHNREALD